MMFFSRYQDRAQCPLGRLAIRFAKIRIMGRWRAARRWTGGLSTDLVVVTLMVTLAGLILLRLAFLDALLFKCPLLDNVMQQSNC
jgi:hypothetical protein